MSEIYVGGSWRTLERGEAYIGGSWRTLTWGEMYADEDWRKVLSFVGALSVSALPTVVSGVGSSNKPVRVTTGSVTAIVTGGLAPLSYSWAQISGPTTTIDAPNSASTTFSAVVGVTDLSATYRVTVTDSAGSTDAADVSATFQNEGM